MNIKIVDNIPKDNAVVKLVIGGYCHTKCGHYVNEYSYRSEKSIWTLAPGLYSRKLYTTSKHIMPKSIPQKGK